MHATYGFSCVFLAVTFFITCVKVLDNFLSLSATDPWDTEIKQHAGIKTNNSICGLIEAIRSAAACEVTCAYNNSGKNERYFEKLIHHLRILPGTFCAGIVLITTCAVALDYFWIYKNGCHGASACNYEKDQYNHLKGILKPKSFNQDHTKELVPEHFQEDYQSRPRVSFDVQPASIIPSLRKAASEDLTSRSDIRGGFRRQSQRIRSRTRKHGI